MPLFKGLVPWSLCVCARCVWGLVAAVWSRVPSPMHALDKSIRRSKMGFKTFESWIREAFRTQDLKEHTESRLLAPF